LVGIHKKYAALEPFGLVCGCTRDRDYSYLGLTKMKIEHKSEWYSAHAVAVVAGQHPNGWVYPTGTKGPSKLQVKTCLFDLMLLLFFFFFISITFFIVLQTIKGHKTAQIGHPRDPISGLEVLGHSNSCTTTFIFL